MGSVKAAVIGAVVVVVLLLVVVAVWRGAEYWQCYTHCKQSMANGLEQCSRSSFCGDLGRAQEELSYQSCLRSCERWAIRAPW